MTSPFPRILVPLDGSTTAEAVLSHLRRFLRRHESQVTLVHAQHLVPSTGEEEAEKYLRRMSFQLTNDGYPTEMLLRRGSPAETVLEAAAERDATMIAMTTHGRTGAARWILGSVAEKILQASPQPVLVTRSLPSTQCRGKLETRPIRNILIPLDGSRCSLRVLDPVLEFIRPVDAHVRLVHVEEPTPFDGRWESPDRTLQEADQLLREACVPPSIDLRKGDPGEEILKAAAEMEADLIAMTTHGRSAPSRWVFGSVTAKVLRSTSIPLLVVRHRVPSAAPAPQASATNQTV